MTANIKALVVYGDTVEVLQLDASTTLHEMQAAATAKVADILSSISATPTTTAKADAGGSAPAPRIEILDPDTAASFVENVLLYKHRLCVRHRTVRGCPDGAACIFAHGEDDLRTKHQNWKDGLFTAAALEAAKQRRIACIQKEAGRKGTPSSEPPQPPATLMEPVKEPKIRAGKRARAAAAAAAVATRGATTATTPTTTARTATMETRTTAAPASAPHLPATNQGPHSSLALVSSGPMSRMLMTDFSFLAGMEQQSQHLERMLQGQQQQQLSPYSLPHPYLGGMAPFMMNPMRPLESLVPSPQQSYILPYGANTASFVSAPIGGPGGESQGM